ncbi:hypothetical protein [Agromyces silvae]|uniref:hypothetical protein n=1 Tax=Agromyces silvae TaxID=3388266 RepID=UPI00280A8EA8|nr:hypothetical protein [Agromyces protaetiae]
MSESTRFPHRMRPDDDQVVARLLSAWEDARLKVEVAAPALDELDAAIRAAGQDGLNAMAVRLESGIEFDLARHVLAGGSAMMYLAEKKDRLARGDPAQ